MREKVKNNKVLQFINKILKIISWIVLILLLILAGFLIYYVMMAKKAEKAGADYKPPMALYTIISPSMVPNINVYDVVFNVKVDDPNDLEVGDIITFVSSDSYMKGMIITHRIVEKYVTNEGVQFKTKGDANVEADSSLVLEENVIGKVLFKIPQLGRVQFFLSSKSGWFIAILIPALAVIAYDIFKLFRLLVLKKQLKNKDNNNNPPANYIEEEDGEKVLNLNSDNTASEDLPKEEINNEIKEEEKTENSSEKTDNKVVIEPTLSQDTTPEANTFNTEPNKQPEVDVTSTVEPTLNSDSVVNPNLFSDIPTLEPKEEDLHFEKNLDNNMLDEKTTDVNKKEDLEQKKENESASEIQKEKDAIIDALLKGNQNNNGEDK